MTGYKICRVVSFDNDGNIDYKDYCLVTLDVPDTAKVVRPHYTNKMRCDYAYVTDMRRISLVEYDFLSFRKFRIGNLDGAPVSYATNLFMDYGVTSYCIGRKISADWLNEDAYIECGNGINFFATKQEAFDFFLKYTYCFANGKNVHCGFRGLVRYFFNWLTGKEYKGRG